MIINIKADKNNMGFLLDNSTKFRKFIDELDIIDELNLDLRDVGMEEEIKVEEEVKEVKVEEEIKVEEEVKEDFENVKKVMKTLTRVKGADAAKAILNSFGTTQLSFLDVGYYEDIINMMKKEMK